MLGLAVLFFLGLWLLITLWATLFGWRLGKKYSHQPWLKWTCATLGFFATMGWYISSEIYHFTKEQIWVTKFCTENPRLKIYITPEQFAEILKTGDASAYRQTQPQYRVIDGENIEINGEFFRLNSSYKKERVESYSNGGDFGNTYYRKRVFLFKEKELLLLAYNEAETEPHGLLGLNEWYHFIHDCPLKKEEHVLLDEFVIFYLSINGVENEE